MYTQNETFTVYLENGKVITVFCHVSQRMGYALEAAAKQKTRVLRID